MASISARFGVFKNTVQQRLRLHHAAPELLDACRTGKMDLAVLKVFTMITDRDRQRTVWGQISDEGYRLTAWNKPIIVAISLLYGPHRRE